MTLAVTAEWLTGIGTLLAVFVALGLQLPRARRSKLVAARAGDLPVIP